MSGSALDGRTFHRFLAAGTFFLKTYRGVLNDLNVFPVPDGDTGSNMYLTARAALADSRPLRDRPLSVVAQAAARGSLLGARGNSGVILSQLLRGFAHNVRHVDAADAIRIAGAMADAVAGARASLTRPVEGTVISVAQAAADEARRLAVHETGLVRLLAGVVRAANDALERTPEQLAILKEAGVVDAGGAGLCYFLEGVLRFLPGETVRATAFPRRPVRSRVFTERQRIGSFRFCTEFILAEARIAAPALRELLEPHGDSLIIAGEAPDLRVHVHAADTDLIRRLAAKHGTLERLKIEDMARQHDVLLVDIARTPYGIVALVPGAGFDRIARELGAEATIALPHGTNPSVADLLVAINASPAQRVYLLLDDPNVAAAAREAVALTQKDVVVVPTRDIVRGLAVLLAVAGRDEPPSDEAVAAAIAGVAAASIFFAGKDSAVDGVALKRGAPAAMFDGRLLTAETLTELGTSVLAALGVAPGSLVTLYYGGRQNERDAKQLAETLAERNEGVSVEYYYGGQADIEYWVSAER